MSTTLHRRMSRKPWLAWLGLLILTALLCVAVPYSFVAGLPFLVVGFSGHALFVVWEDGLNYGEPHEHDKTWLHVAFWGRRLRDDYCCDVCLELMEPQAEMDRAAEEAAASPDFSRK